MIILPYIEQKYSSKGISGNKDPSDFSPWLSFIIQILRDSVESWSDYARKS